MAVEAWKRHPCGLLPVQGAWPKQLPILALSRSRGVDQVAEFNSDVTRTNTAGSELFIVDNRDLGWKVQVHPSVAAKYHRCRTGLHTVAKRISLDKGKMQSTFCEPPTALVLGSSPYLGVFSCSLFSGSDAWMPAIDSSLFSSTS
jgi:hypothetical protein